MIISNLLNCDSIEFNRLRIYDFIYLFPHFLNEMSLPRVKGLTAIKRKIVEIPTPYETLPDKRRLFSQMSDYHIQAMQILKSKNIFREIDGKIIKSDVFFSDSIQELITSNIKDDDTTYTELFEILNNTTLNGPSGIKQRTGLMEHRYDAV